MKCAGCGCESLELDATCRRCGAPLVAIAGAGPGPLAGPADELPGLRLEAADPAEGSWLPGRPRSRGTPAPGRGGELVEMLDDDAIEIDEDDLKAVGASAVAAADDEDTPFHIDDDLFAGIGAAALAPPSAAAAAGGEEHGAVGLAGDTGLSGPAFTLPRFESPTPAIGEPIIDRDDEVPERYWPPEVAGLGRRALAVLVDQAILAAVLGVFFLGALTSLRLGGFDGGLLVSAAGLGVSALPFTLLGLLLSLTYYLYFHGVAGRTPGKALAGIELRACDGGALGWQQVALRWLGAILGLGCAGAGIVWAVFEPRRRGWADLASGTVVSRPRLDDSR